MTKSIIIFIVGLTASAVSLAQPSWNRDEEDLTEPKLNLFHSTNAINLPTATTIQQFDFLYGIQHRWRQPTAAGMDELLGIDGPVVMRMKLGFAVTDDILVQAARTNELGTWDVEVKHNFLNMKSESLPLAFSYNVGGTYIGNNDLTVQGHMQAYLSLIANTMLLDKSLGLGVVVSGLHNANPFWFESITSTNVGWYAQYYIDDLWSVNIEGSHIVNGWTQGYDSYAASIEMETGGHFFKFIVSNNTNIHLAGIFDGAPQPISIDSDRGALDNVHFGFQISRNL